MELRIELNNKAKSPIGLRSITTIVSRTFSEAGFQLRGKKVVQLSVAFVSSSEMRGINRRFRKKDAPTDILSFGTYRTLKEIEAETKKELFLGELILCFSIIKKSATINKLPLSKEVAFVLSHGVLHLLGLRHSRGMYAIQDRIAK